MNIPDLITVEIDTREQYPVLFPATIQVPHPTRAGAMVIVRVAVQKVKLDAGDYRLAEYPNCCVIERKASQLELFKNLEDHKDSIRQAKAFIKLLTCEYPYLLLEVSPTELGASGGLVQNTERLIAKLCFVVVRQGFGLLWIPWGKSTAKKRRELGRVMVHLMLACAMEPKPSKFLLDNS